MSMTFGAVIWDADYLSSVNTAYAPESCFTVSPPEYDSTFCIFDIEVPTPNS